ncbi:MAG TPA: pyridoxamine 5'-phosphate oxidase family protein [Flavitalea sp.]|nr:pyridoxamine 5'-phosphate oxidase family protein [Flavitalea sp.]
MLPETHLPFLQEKISDLRSALFFSLGNSVLRIPTTIVTTLKVDDVGQVWFFVHRPMQNIQEFDREFPARLEFCRKGKSFYLKILGKACIVNDPEELNGLVDVSEDIKTKAMSQLVLVKVKIQSAEYTQKNPPETNGWMHSIRAHFNKWFGNQQHHDRPYSLQPAH